MPRILIIALFIYTGFLSPAIALEGDKSKAVILAYHRIGEPESPQTNISPQLFDSHISEITNGAYTVLPLPQIVEALKSNIPLPPRTIAITFEGGYSSAYNNGIKKLIKKQIPFTVFIASKNTKIPNHINWKIIKKIAKFHGASFGVLPSNYAHITHMPKAEATRLINQSRIALKENAKIEAKFFSYPFGEISNTLIDIAKEQGFDAAFGIHSGPANSNSNQLTLPRYAITSQYGDIDRFRMITETMPLPTTEAEPENWALSSSLSQIGFTVPRDLEHELKALSCHVSGQAKPAIEILSNRIEIIPQEEILNERTRLNCTLPYFEDDRQRWRWLGMLFHTAQDN